MSYFDNGGGFQIETQEEEKRKSCSWWQVFFANDLLFTNLLGKLDTGVAVICWLSKSMAWKYLSNSVISVKTTDKYKIVATFLYLTIK